MDKINFQTPVWICDLMSKMLENNVSHVLEPTPGKGNLVTSLESFGFNVTAPQDFFSVDGNFDAIVMNPPFSPMSLGYEILFKSMKMTNRIIALMPWLTLINSKKRTNVILNYGILSVTHLPRSVFKGSRVQTCILNLKRGFTGECKLLFAENIE